MKKLLTLAALLSAVTLSYGQGQLTFNNSAATLMGTNSAPAGHQGAWTGAQTGVTANYTQGGRYVFALFVADSTVSSIAGLTDPRWSLTGSYATNTTAASGGRIIGGQPVINGYGIGATGNFMVRGWDAGIGATWADVLTWYGTGDVSKTGWLGTSTIATVALGGGASPIPGLFGATAGSTIGGFTLQQINPIPEPTSFALAGLGAAALLIFRRRK